MFIVYVYIRFHIYMYILNVNSVSSIFHPLLRPFCLLPYVCTSVYVCRVINIVDVVVVVL